jgi:hypothetical protein
MAAGAAGTAAMTAWQELSARLSPGGEPGDPGESPADPWEAAAAPAKVAKLAADRLGIEVSPERIPLLTNAMHWATGTGWGTAFGLLRGARRARPLRAGLAFGVGVWAGSYAQLVPLGIYEPPWRYPPAVLAMDLSYHLVYGAGTGLAHRALLAIGP